MTGPEFFQTQMGRMYYDLTMPALVKAINRLAIALEEANKTHSTTTTTTTTKQATAVGISDKVNKSMKHLVEGFETYHDLIDFVLMDSSTQAEQVGMKPETMRVIQALVREAMNMHIEEVPLK